MSFCTWVAVILAYLISFHHVTVTKSVANSQHTLGHLASTFTHAPNIRHGTRSHKNEAKATPHIRNTQHTHYVSHTTWNTCTVIDRKNALQHEKHTH